MRGSKPGERRGGRKKGTPNKATRELKELARDYTADALLTLEQVMKSSESDAARVAAAKEFLDRGYGRAAQAHIGGDPDDPAIRHIHEVRRTLIDPRTAE